VHSLLLKAAATALTLVAAAAAAAHVGGHVKNAAAPLHPGVLGAPPAVSSPSGGSLKLSPAVRTSDVQTVTSTYVS